MTCPTYNLISLLRNKVLCGSGIEDLGIQAIVNKACDILTAFEKEPHKMRIFPLLAMSWLEEFIQGKQDSHKGSILALEKNYAIDFV